MNKLEKIDNIRKKSQMGTKAESRQSVFAQLELSDAKWRVNSPEEYAREGYRKNVIAYRCIKEIADNIGGLHWEVYNKRTGRVIDKHPLLELLKKPNPMQSGRELMIRLSSFKQLSGNSFLQRIGPNMGPPTELYVLNPGNMKVEPGSTLHMPQWYEYRPRVVKNLAMVETTLDAIRFPVNQMTGASEIMHSKMFNPLNDWMGQSPLSAASMAIDLHNESSEWNMKLLQNGARPSGALIAKENFSVEQIEIMKKTFHEAYGGPENTGKPMMLGGDLEWIDMMLSPKDMDFITSKSTAAKDIATAFRVPPVLLNISSDTTFANMKEARLSMVENTIIPEADTLMDDLNDYLVPLFGDNIGIRYNKDKIPAIMSKRSETYAVLKDVNFLTVNELRELAGFDAIEGEEGNKLHMSNENNRREGDERDNSNGQNGATGNSSGDNPNSKNSAVEIVEVKAATVKTGDSDGHYHKYDPLESGQTTESDDHVHNYIVGDVKTSVVDGHSHSIDK